jgi:tubulin-folding cofactor B
MQMTVEAVKLKLGTHCGTLASDMILHLKDGSGKLVAILAESHRKLGFFSPEDGWVLLFQRLCTLHKMHIGALQAGCSKCCHMLCRWVLHVIDTNPNSLSARGWLEDTSKVQKYVMSDADYDARENTYRRHKAQKQKVPRTVPCSPFSF